MSSLWNDGLNDYDRFPDPPNLPPTNTPGFCESNRGLRAFLLASRRLSDDVLKQRLNSVLNNKNGQKEQLCNDFLKDVIIRSWNERLKGLEFCENVVLKSLKDELTSDEEKITKSNEELRLDPYAQRDIENAKDLKLYKINQLQYFLNNEKMIEHIVQSKSREQIIETCGLSDLVKNLPKF